jgi:hypothetical protein
MSTRLHQLHVESISFRGKDLMLEKSYIVKMRWRGDASEELELVAVRSWKGVTSLPPLFTNLAHANFPQSWTT